jgi:hypothetical protein
MNQREKYFLNTLWIAQEVSRSVYPGIERDDLFQVLAQTLWFSIEKYVEAKQQRRKVGPIVQYLYTAVKNRRTSYIRSHLAKKNSQRVSLEEMHENLLPRHQMNVFVEVKQQKVIIDGKDILRYEPVVIKRKAFYLSVIGFSYREIAGRLDLTESEVRRYIHETRKRLKKIYQDG